MKTSFELETIAIPEGEIAMRDDRRKTKWTARIDSFLAGQTPVTQKLYQQVTRQNPSKNKAPLNPVDSVSWLDAVTFCNLLSREWGLIPAYELIPDQHTGRWIKKAEGFRLLTDAEWQYACQAGTNHPAYGPLDQICWYQENAGGMSHPVAQKEPNAWGLYDMLGNVWEWCWDLYDPEVYGAYRVFRGGGWADQARGCLATNRRRSHPDFSIDDLGFRIARSVFD
ncbi:MAG: SUMF1/EgtB/PvdO family nonheme iron enzyme [Pseudomonadota bacterium]